MLTDLISQTQQANGSDTTVDAASVDVENTEPLAEEVVDSSTVAEGSDSAEENVPKLTLEQELNAYDPDNDESAPEPLSYESEKFQELEQFVQSRFGFGLKDAVEAIKKLSERELEVTQQAAEVQVAEVVSTIKAEWGVNEAEYERRMGLVIDYYNKLKQTKPDLASKLDNADGIRLMWAKVSKTSPKAVSGGKSGKAAAPSFKRSDIKRMLLNDPAAYAANQAAIVAASRAGTIIEDLG